MPRALRMLILLFDRHGNTEDRVGRLRMAVFFSAYSGQFSAWTWMKQTSIYFLIRSNSTTARITRFSIQEARYLLVYHNRTDFLPDEMVT